MSGSPMPRADLRLERLSHAFGDREVFAELNLTVVPGEFVVIVGPSGCGKSTVLNILAGNLAPSRGQVVGGGRSRMVYQQNGLLPWLTVAENIGLGLRGVPDLQIRSRQCAELIDLIRLSGFERHYPHQLSGGMRQRVELARALAGDAELLLMDEPFSALDYQTRLRMRRELAAVLEVKPRTVVFVTHDIEEAAQLADRILVFNGQPARVVREVRLTSRRPRAATQPQVIEAVHRILTDLGLESDEEVGKVGPIHAAVAAGGRYEQ